jgi:hypothetical protein
MLNEIGEIYFSMGKHSEGMRVLREAHIMAVESGQHQLANSIQKILQQNDREKSP